MKLCLQYLTWYSLTAILTYPLHFNTVVVGVGNTRKIYVHVEIIEVNLIKSIEKY